MNNSWKHRTRWQRKKTHKGKDWNARLPIGERDLLHLQWIEAQKVKTGEDPSIDWFDALPRIVPLGNIYRYDLKREQLINLLQRGVSKHIVLTSKAIAILNQAKLLKS